MMPSKKPFMKYMLGLEKLATRQLRKSKVRILENFLSIAHYYPDTNDLLKKWETETHIASTKHLAAFILDERGNIFDKLSYSLTELKDWLLSETTIKRLEAAFYRYENEPFSEKLSWLRKY